MRGKFHKGATFAGTVWSSQYRALFYGSECVKQLSYILLGLLLAKHANEKLSISEAFAFALRSSSQLLLLMSMERQILKRNPGITFGFVSFLARDTEILCFCARVFFFYDGWGVCVCNR